MRKQTRPKVPEIRLSLFGASGSGKSTFLASYYGNQQRNAFEDQHGYRLEAEDASDGNTLLSRYYRMEGGEFPLGTDAFGEYEFGLKVHQLPEACLRIIWYDYPGGWWERTPAEESEAVARHEAFSKLLTSHVGFLLVDGKRYEEEGVTYVRQLFDQFRNEIRKVADHFAARGEPLTDLPSQWIILLSKCDLLATSTTAETVCKRIVADASDQLAGIAKAVHSRTFGRQFLLVSSVRAEGTRVIDAHDYIGLHLIAPVALLSTLSDVAERASKGGGFGTLRAILFRLSKIVDLLDGLDDFLPLKYQLLTKLLKAFDLKQILEHGSDFYRKKQAVAAARGKSLEAVAAAMKAELRSDEAQFAYYVNQG